LKMKEPREVMNTIRAFAADDATVIFGTVCDEAIGDALRVTVVATGLGRAASKKQSTPFSVVRTGTDNAPVMVAPHKEGAGGSSYSHLDTPAVWRNNRESAQTRVSALDDSSSDRYDIPAFLRKQAD